MASSRTKGACDWVADEENAAALAKTSLARCEYCGCFPASAIQARARSRVSANEFLSIRGSTCSSQVALVLGSVIVCDAKAIHASRHFGDLASVGSRVASACCIWPTAIWAWV